MKKLEQKLLIGVVSQLVDLLDEEEELFDKERPFLFSKGPVHIIPLDEKDQKRKDQIVMEREMATDVIITQLKNIVREKKSTQVDLL